MHIIATALLGAIAAAWIFQAARATWGMHHVPSLDPAPTERSTGPSISVIFAARDEAEALPTALPTLLHQDYPNYEVVAVNDRSQDATGAILRQFARTSKRMKVVEINELPSGWLGKPHALVRGAEQAKGDWLVFTDADVRFGPHLLRGAIEAATERGWDHLTILAGLDMRGFWETAILTFFYLGFVLVIEPWQANDARSRRYVGVGAFQMLRRSAYDAVGGHRGLAMEVIEDMKLAKRIKEGGFRSGLGFAQESLRLRWYCSPKEIVRGLTKNLFAAADYSVPQAAFMAALTIAMSVLPFLAVAYMTGWARIFAGIAAGTAVGFHAMVARQNKVSPLYALTHPLGALIFTYILARSTLVTLARGGVNWRNTFYPLEELRRGRG